VREERPTAGSLHTAAALGCATDCGARPVFVDACVGWGPEIWLGAAGDDEYIPLFISIGASLNRRNAGRQKLDYAHVTRIQLCLVTFGKN
jgi:hypothetical protein